MRATARAGPQSTEPISPDTPQAEAALAAFIGYATLAAGDARADFTELGRRSEAASA